MSEFGNGVRRIIIYQTDLPKIVNIILRSCSRQSRTRIHSAYVHTLSIRIFITYYIFFKKIFSSRMYSNNVHQYSDFKNFDK